MKKLSNYIRNNSKILLFTLLLFILLLSMTNWILNKTEKKYYAEGIEPTGNSQLIKLENLPFKQIAIAQENKICGIDLIIAPNDDTSIRTITVKVSDNKGNLLASATKTIAGTYHNEYILFDKPIELNKNQIINLEFISSLELNCFSANSDKTLRNTGNNLYVKLIYDYVDKESFSKIVYCIVILIWLILSILVVNLKNTKKIEYYFGIIYFLIGLAYMLIIPISAVPDEPNHFLRCYEISEGNFISQKNDSNKVGNYMSFALNNNFNGPYCRWRHLNEIKKAKVSNEDIRFLEFPNTALYSPFTYTPQVLGITFAKIFTKNVLIIAYMGRVFAWLTVGIILFFSVRYIPFGKLLLSMIALLPISMQENISLSADGVTFAICTAIIAFILFMRYTYTSKMKMRHYIIMYLLIFYISTIKIVYIPLCLMFFLIPIDRFNNKINYLKNVIVAIIIALTCCLTWLKISSSILVVCNTGADSHLQSQYILSNIPNYIEILFNTIIKGCDYYIKTLFGSELGWSNIKINMLIIYFTITLIMMVCIKEDFTIPFNEKSTYLKTILGIILFCTLILIFTSIYIQWTPAYLDYVSGVQGRYFLPLLMLIFILLKKTSINYKSETTNIYNNFGIMSFITIIFINICILVTLAVFFVV